MKFFSTLGVLLLASVGFVKAADDSNIIKATKFNGRLDGLYYFDDTEVILTIDRAEFAVYTSFNGGQDWARAKDIDGKAMHVHLHPRDNNVAVVTGSSLDHWITEDRGKSWRKFRTEYPADMGEPISFHYSDSKKIMFHTPHYQFTSVGKSYYTTDGFKTIKTLQDFRRHCLWAKSTDLFETGDKDADNNRILCIVRSTSSDLQRDFRLLISDDYFATSREPKIFNDRTVSGMVNMAPVKGFLVAAARAVNSLELVLYVTKDTTTWHRAIFGEHRIEEDSYTILESTNYSMQVEVTPERNVDMGVLFSSNSNGTYFTKLAEHVNRDQWGIIDFEKIPNIQGVFMINTVDNWKDVESRLGAPKEIRTKFTFDDGRTFQSPKADGEDLHLHAVTELVNFGRVFSSPAPGMLLGNGNTGDHLTDRDKSNLFVSDDAGRTWSKTSLKGPQKYEFGDQGGVLIACNNALADSISYSLDHGKTWKEIELGVEIMPYELTTVPDSSSLKFLLTGHDDDQWYIFAIDFNGLHERKCGNSDFENWYARTDDKGEPACIMGHTQHFRRRKADADCFINDEFREALPISEPCECTDADFECDYNYRRHDDGKECVAIGRILDPDNQCKSPEGTFMGTSGWRLIPGNDCKRTSGTQKDKLVEHSCQDVFGGPASGDISSTFWSPRGNRFIATYYLERDPKVPGDDETVIALTDEGHSMKAWKSHDHGKNWEPAIPGEDDPIVGVYQHPHNSDFVYFITPSTTVYYSKDRAKTIHRFEAPNVPNVNGLPILSFHQTQPNWLIWTGDQDCWSNDSKYCRVTTHVSKKNGAEGSWDLLSEYVRRCQFMYRENRESDENLIFCEHWKSENVQGDLQLLSSDNMFNTQELVFDDMLDFATMGEFIVVAVKTADRRYLEAHASVDGKVFAEAKFPKNFPVEHETAYTVLDSQTNSVFLHVTESPEKGRAYGPIMKSNSNGTSYVISIRNVNRDDDGYVDWEKMQGIEGVAIVNVVDNVDELKRGLNKKIKTMISHDDGASWSYLPCPEKDLDGKDNSCDPDDLSKRSLHLHGYTERRDPRDTFSSPSAVGLLIGVGNVGTHLGLYNEGNTFLTKDAGVTWKQIQKGTYLWEYGDQGSVIVLVQRDTPTNKVIYSIDEGDTWTEHEFDSEGVMSVDRITTVPSDNSRNFLLWGKKDGRLTTVNLDFTGTTNRQCYLPDHDDINNEKSDYDLWFPTHPGKKDEPDCLFGHKSLYYRKKPGTNCYNGPLIDRLHGNQKICGCTRQDFECDYNFERVADGRCQLIEGLEALPAEHVCQEDPDRVEYWDITGYRKLTLSTCHEGRELEFGGSPHPCPKHQKEFDRKYASSGASIFFAVVIPIAAAAGIGYWVYTRWDGKFGRIRLGDGGVSSGEMFRSDAPWIAWPVAVVSGLVAVLAALPLLAGSLWRSVSSRLGGGYGTRTYNTRSSFARGRDYDVVDNDEGELLGDDSDEEV